MPLAEASIQRRHSSCRRIGSAVGRRSCWSRRSAESIHRLRPIGGGGVPVASGVGRSSVGCQTQAAGCQSGVGKACKIATGRSARIASSSSVDGVVITALTEASTSGRGRVSHATPRSSSSPSVSRQTMGTRRRSAESRSSPSAASSAARSLGVNAGRFAVATMIRPESVSGNALGMLASIRGRPVGAAPLPRARRTRASLSPAQQTRSTGAGRRKCCGARGLVSVLR